MRTKLVVALLVPGVLGWVAVLVVYFLSNRTAGTVAPPPERPRDQGRRAEGSSPGSGQEPRRAEDRKDDAAARGQARVEGTRHVLAAIVQAAEQNRRRPAPLEGDALTQYYVREAAAAARRLPADQAIPGFLAALGLGLDESYVLRGNPFTREFARKVEPTGERERRLAALGAPTMGGRRDLCQHFVVSVTLTELLGPALAEAAGLYKEQHDADSGGSGFSFADLCADMAGVAFAEQLKSSDELARLATTFTVARYLPDVTGLPEGLVREDFVKAYGSVSDERFKAEMAALRKRIQTLPGFQTGPR